VAAAGQAVAHVVVKTQIFQRPAHVPIRGIAIIGLVVAVREIIVDE
jgi:energy-converting hydrogenase Eha subunit H